MSCVSVLLLGMKMIFLFVLERGGALEAAFYRKWRRFVGDLNREAAL